MQPFIVEVLPARVVLAPNSLHQIKQEVEHLGKRRALVLSTSEQRDLAERVAGLLGDLCVGIFDRAVMHVPVETVDAAEVICQQTQADTESNITDAVIQKIKADTPRPQQVVDVWQASPEGFYDVQDLNATESNLRGIFKSDAQGKFWFRTVKPLYYPIPTDGPVGELLRATRRHPMRPAHIHFMFQALGYERLITHLFVEGDPYLESDAIFGVKDSLVIDFIRNQSQDDALKYGFEAPFYEV